MAHTINAREWQLILKSLEGRADHEREGQQRLFRVGQALAARDFERAALFSQDGAPLDLPLILDDTKGGAPGARTLIPVELLEVWAQRPAITLLCLAAASNDLEQIQWLFEQGASADMVLADGRDAAWVALDHGANEAYELLTRFGFNVNARLTDGTHQTRLMGAVLASNVDVVHHLLRRKAHVNWYDRDGRTALHHNLRMDPYEQADMEIATALLNAGSNPNIEDNEGIPAHALAQNEAQQSVFMGHELGRVTDEVRAKLNPQPEPEPTGPDPTDPLVPQLKHPPRRRL